MSDQDRSKVIIHTAEEGEHEMTEFCWCEPRIEICEGDSWTMVQ